MKHLKSFNEGLFGFGVDKDKKIPIWIYINIFNNGDAFIINEGMGQEVNRKLMSMMDDKLGLGFLFNKKSNDCPSDNKLEMNKLDEVSDFLTNLGLERIDTQQGRGSNKILFKGKLSLNDLKKLD